MLSKGLKFRAAKASLFTFLLSCGSEVAIEARSVPTALGDECKQMLGKEWLFVGSRECLNKLPKRYYSGFWMLDHEYSIFYKRRPKEVKAYDEGAIWMDFATKSAQKEVENLTRLGGRRIYKIKFYGAISSRKGIYGNGLFHSGGVISNIKHIKRLP